MTPQDKTIHQKIDKFIAKTRELNGINLADRNPWNTAASTDAIRHFAYGTSDDNPLWIDAEYAARTSFGKQLAPPCFVISVLYPFSFGEPMTVPLSNFNAELEIEWFLPIFEGDELRAQARQIDVYESKNRSGKRFVCIVTETIYHNANNQVVAQSSGTVARIEHSATELLFDRHVYEYSQSELADIDQAIRQETHRGDRLFGMGELRLHAEIPERVIGPMTVGDLISWQAAIGPPYRAGSLGYRDVLAAPHRSTIVPKLGWPVEHSQQHEDINLTKQRGMLAPFDYGAMRFAWIAPLLTNWIGDDGFLRRLHLKMKEPILYGDTSWHRAKITDVKPIDTDGVNFRHSVALRLHSVNQLGSITTTGTAEVIIPMKNNPRRRAIGKLHQPVTEIFSGPLLPAWTPIHLHIDKIAAKLPNQVAMADNKQQLTYRQLSKQTDTVATCLQQYGVHRGDLVAICTDRSVDAVTAMIGILKAGAAYLPLDPDYPDQRISEWVESSRASLLLLDETTCDRKIQATASNLFLYNILQPLAGNYRRQKINPDDLAYVMYTSGTSGRGKGVEVSHGSLAHYLPAIQSSLNISRDDIYLQSASFAFSASSRQIWMPLGLGAKIILANKVQCRDPLALLELMCQKDVTVWDTIPSVLRHALERLMILNAKHRETLLPPTLRLLALTGEPLHWRLVKQWNALFGENTQVVNLYSQTETVGTVSAYYVSELDENRDGFVPIGKPIANTEIHISYEPGDNLSGDKVGKILVGGLRLARGYRHDLALTMERFIQTPATESTKTHASENVLYHTGDLARIRPDETIEYVGRTDRRIKLRGFRIEPDEVEAAIIACSGVQAAVVDVMEDSNSERRLVAWVVANRQTHPDNNKLRNKLAIRLPVYMIPSSFHWLLELPRLASGKVDRTKLLTRFSTDRDPQSITEPTSATEQELARIWAAVLDIDHIDANQDFFEMGGDSLLAVSLMSKIEQRFNVHVSIDQLYLATTVEKFAEWMQQTSASTNARLVIPLKPDGIRIPLFCLPGGGGHPFSFLALTHHLPPDQPAYGLQLRGLDGKDIPINSVEAMAIDFIDQIQQVQPHGPYQFVGYSFGGQVAYEMAQILTERGEIVSFLGLLDTRALVAERIMAFRMRIKVQIDHMRSLTLWARLCYLCGLIERRLTKPFKLINHKFTNALEIGGSELERRLQKTRLAQNQARHRYRPSPYAGDVILFRAEPDKWDAFLNIDPTYGWSRLVKGRLEVHDIKGTHLEIFNEPQVLELATRVTEYLSVDRQVLNDRV